MYFFLPYKPNSFGRCISIGLSIAIVAMVAKFSKKGNDKSLQTQTQLFEVFSFSLF